MHKVVNWKKLIIILSTVLAVTVLWILFLDTILKIAIEAGGTAAAGAKTNVAKADLRLKDGSLNVYKLQVANKNDPWKNVVDIGRIRTALNGEQLVYKRFIMDEVTIEDIQTGTLRKTFGGIVKAPPKKGGLDFGKITNSLNIDPSRALKNAADLGPMESKNELPKIEAENNAKLAEASAKLNSFKPEEDLQKINVSGFQNLDKVKDLSELQSKLKEIESISSQINAVQKTYDSTNSLVNTNLSQVNENIKKLSDLKNKDLEKIYTKLNIGNYDMAAIGRSMLGPKVNGYIDTGLSYMAMAKKYMPPKKSKPPKKERFKGITVHFNNRTYAPAFLIRKISLSGATEQTTGNILAYKGEIHNITSQPAVLGKPMTIDISGKYLNNPVSNLSIKGILDHTKDAAADQISFSLSGYKLDGQALWDEKSIPLHIVKGTGIISGKFLLNDEGLDGLVSFTGNNFVFENKADKNGSFESMVAEAIQTAPSIRIDIYVSGTLENPNTKITTNLDGIIAAHLNKVVGEKVNAAKKQVEEEYNKQVGDQQKALMEKVNAQTKELNELSAAKQKAIEEKQDEIKKIQEELQKKIAEQTSGATKELDKLKQNLPTKLF